MNNEKLLKGKKEMTRITRSEARKRAFEMVFAGSGDCEGIEEQLAVFADEHPEYEKQLGYITKAALGAIRNMDELKECIDRNIAKSWSYARLSKMCRAVLLLAIYEMKNIDDVPKKVAVNEAVELAKIYGDDNEPALVNGILGSVIKNEFDE